MVAGTLRTTRILIVIEFLYLQSDLFSVCSLIYSRFADWLFSICRLIILYLQADYSLFADWLFSICRLIFSICRLIILYLQADLYSGALFITQSVQITPDKEANIYIAAIILVLISALFTIAGECGSLSYPVTEGLQTNYS